MHTHPISFDSDARRNAKGYQQPEGPGGVHETGRAYLGSGVIFHLNLIFHLKALDTPMALPLIINSRCGNEHR